MADSDDPWRPSTRDEWIDAMSEAVKKGFGSARSEYEEAAAKAAAEDAAKNAGKTEDTPKRNAWWI